MDTCFAAYRPTFCRLVVVWLQNKPETFIYFDTTSSFGEPLHSGVQTQRTPPGPAAEIEQEFSLFMILALCHV